MKIKTDTKFTYILAVIFNFLIADFSNSQQHGSSKVSDETKEASNSQIPKSQILKEIEDYFLYGKYSKIIEILKANPELLTEMIHNKAFEDWSSSDFRKGSPDANTKTRGSNKVQNLGKETILDILLKKLDTAEYLFHNDESIPTFKNEVLEILRKFQKINGKGIELKSRHIVSLLWLVNFDPDKFEGLVKDGTFDPASYSKLILDKDNKHDIGRFFAQSLANATASVDNVSLLPWSPKTLSNESIENYSKSIEWIMKNDFLSKDQWTQTLQMIDLTENSSGRNQRFKFGNLTMAFRDFFKR